MLFSSATRRKRASKRAVAWRRLRAVGALLLSLGAVGTLFLVGRPLLHDDFPIAPLVNSASPARENGSNSRRKPARRDPNSPSAIAADWLAAWQSPAKGPASKVASTSTKSRFGLFVPQPVIAAFQIAAFQSATPPDSIVFDAQNPVLSLDVAASQGLVLPIGPLAIAPLQNAGLSSLPGFATGTQTLLARGEERAREAARQRQLFALQAFLRDAQRADAAILANEETARLRLLNEEIARLPAPDFAPLSAPLPDAQTQLEMTNLRLRLNPAWRTPDVARDARDREAARLRLAALEEQWSAQLQSIANARELQLSRLREERPRALRAAGLKQLAANAQAQKAVTNQASAQLSRRVQLQLRQEFARAPLQIKVGR